MHEHSVLGEVRWTQTQTQINVVFSEAAFIASKVRGLAGGSRRSWEEELAGRQTGSSGPGKLASEKDQLIRNRLMINTSRDPERTLPLKWIQRSGSEEWVKSRGRCPAGC